MQLLPAPGGITFIQVANLYVTSFGTMNALAIGTPQTGLTTAALGSGALYFSQYQVQFSGLPGPHTASLSAYVSTNFNHPAALVVESCPSTSGCTSAAGYSAMSTNAAAPTVVVANMGNATTTVGLGIFLPDNDGATAFTGVDAAAVITFTMTDLRNNQVVGTATVSFAGIPLNTVQDAVQMQLSSAPGGLTLGTGGGADYAMAFGTVNGLGISPGAGLTTVSTAGGMIYSTPYVIAPAFADFASTSATIKVYVSSNFAHPAVLALEDSAASGGPYTAISTAVGAQTTVTGAAADRGSFTRYLGLFVALNNAGGPFLGGDNATLTFTITVP